MAKISVETSSKNYNVYIGENVLDNLSSFIHNQECSKILVITDQTVEKLHLDTVLNSISNISNVVYTVPSGEKAKTFDVYYDCLTFALEQQLDRKSLLLALGGGAVGDLAGFVAATFMRGIPFIQIPTTILAHDSAVGGKVAINHPSGKNMIGAFYQPEAVFYQTSFLSTLPPQELRSGFGEVIKHALISSPIFYRQVVDTIDNLSEVTEEYWCELLEKGILVKKEVVEKDEKENNIRAFLNFGHTLGHAIEAEMGYGKFTHGEAIVIGMLFALSLSIHKCKLDFPIEELKNWLQSLGYLTEIPEDLSIDRLISRMKKDKKTINGNINFVLLESIGKPVLVKIDESELKKEIVLFKERVWK